HAQAVRSSLAKGAHFLLATLPMRPAMQMPLFWTLVLFGCQPHASEVPADSDAAACAVSEITSGDGHACARRADGSVVCWGHFLSVGFCAPSGTGAAATVDGLAPVKSVSAQHAHTCAVSDAGSLYC